MRAVLVALGYQSSLAPIVDFRPSPLFRLVGKPIIVHIVERLVRQGITQFDVILHHLPEKVEQLLGDGKRWGIHITYHLAKDPEHPFMTLFPSAKSWPFDQILLGQGDLFPIIHSRLLTQRVRKTQLFFHRRTLWTGWGTFPTRIFAKVFHKVPFRGLLKQVRSHAKIVHTPLYFSTQTFEEFHRDNHRMLGQQVVGHLLPLTARMINPGVWLSQAVTLHPSVTVVPPVFVGDHCQISQGCKIGPNAIIENDCFIDSNTLVKNSIICPGSYLGESLEISDSIVERHHLIHLKLHTKVDIPDDHILGDLHRHSLKKLFINLFERFVAAIGLLMFSPLFIKPLCRKKVVALPTFRNPSQWRTFDQFLFKKPFKRKIFNKIPALLNIVKGEVHFVGLPPRTREELSQLSRDWQDFVLRGKLGVFTLAELDDGDFFEERQYATEAYYVTNMSLWNDLRILFKC